MNTSWQQIPAWLTLQLSTLLEADRIAHPVSHMIKKYDASSGTLWRNRLVSHTEKVICYKGDSSANKYIFTTRQLCGYTCSVHRLTLAVDHTVCRSAYSDCHVDSFVSACQLFCIFEQEFLAMKICNNTHYCAYLCVGPEQMSLKVTQHKHAC